MTVSRPDFISQGEPARLFPVLSTTSKEGRTTSIVLACLSKIDDLGKILLSSVGQRVGKIAVVETYTEIVFKSQKGNSKDRPDGLIILRIGKRKWTALVEAKVGNNLLSEEQIEKYRDIAKEHSLDCVITISNQFATSPTIHPLIEVRKSRSRIPVFHWSWMFILTTVDLLISGSVKDGDQVNILNELRRFLSHESAGVRGFDRMPPEWTDINRLVSAGGKIPTRSPEASAVLDAWHQETKDLSLILSRQTEATVTEKIPRKHMNDAAMHQKDELPVLCSENCIKTHLEIPDAASLLEIVADLSRRTIDVGMTLRAPEDKISSKARVNWLLRQLKSEDASDLFIRLNWPGTSEATQFSFQQLRDDASIVEKDKKHLQVRSFHVYFSRRIGGRFTQRANFISELEEVVPEFYREVGQLLSAWRKSAPQVKEDRPSASEVSVEALSEEANDV